MSSAIDDATKSDMFIVNLNNGLCLVVHKNRAGGADALHSNPICGEAGRLMKKELAGERLPRGNYHTLAARCELRARILRAIEGTDTKEEIACALESARPWEECHADEIPF